MSQVFKIKCDCCEGYGKVAMLRMTYRDPFARVVPEMCNRPMSVTVAKAREIMLGYGSRGRADRAKVIVIKHLAQRLESVPCPHCRATGYAYVLTFG